MKDIVMLADLSQLTHPNVIRNPLRCPGLFQLLVLQVLQALQVLLTIQQICRHIIVIIVIVLYVLNISNSQYLHSRNETWFISSVIWRRTSKHGMLPNIQQIPILIPWEGSKKWMSWNMRVVNLDFLKMSFLQRRLFRIRADSI